MAEPMRAPRGETGGVVIFLPRRRRRSAWRELSLAVLAAGVIAALLFALARPFDAHGEAAAPPPPVGAE
jgi:hypothetical protein